MVTSWSGWLLLRTTLRAGAVGVKRSGERLNIRDILKNGRGGTTPMTSGRWFNKEKTSGRGADRQARSPTVSECELQLSDVLLAGAPGGLISARDRKSTRLNSSHVKI